MNPATRLLDDAIVEAGIKTFGGIAGEVIEQRIGYGSAAEVWYCLGIHEQPGSRWMMVGRRRSRAELLSLAKRGPVDFRTCPESA